MSKLQQIRKLHKITQSELSVKANVNLNSIRKYEIGAKKIDNAKLETLCNLCDALNCSLVDIIENDALINKLKNL